MWDHLMPRLKITTTNLSENGQNQLKMLHTQVHQSSTHQIKYIIVHCIVQSNLICKSHPPSHIGFCMLRIEDEIDWGLPVPVATAEWFQSLCVEILCVHVCVCVCVCVRERERERERGKVTVDVQVVHTICLPMVWLIVRNISHHLIKSMFTIHVPFLEEYDSGHYFTERNGSLAEWIHNYARTCTQANLAAHRSRFLFGSYLVRKVCINSICMLPTRFIAASQPTNLSVLTRGVGFPCSQTIDSWCWL